MDIKAEIEAGKKVIAGLPVLTEWRKANRLAYELISNGWMTCSSYEVTDKPGDSSFEAVRLGNLNLIITSDLQFYTDYITAMEVCKALHLVHREDRIAVCQIVRDGRTAAEVLTYNDKHCDIPSV